MKKIALISLLLACLLAMDGFVRADSAFVTNPGINAITKYDGNGNGSLFTTQFVNGPTGIALDSGGNVFVATKNNTIEKFGPDGAFLGLFAKTGLSTPMGLAFNRAGHLFAANLGSNTVEQFAADGTDLGVFASVNQPTGIAFDPQGNLCVASLDNLIRRFAPNGSALADFSSPALKSPQGLAFDAAGILYVANSGSGVIEKFSSKGTDLGPAPGTTASTASPVSVAGTQQIYIAFRTDGIAGDGSAANPFDGSTQPKLDAIFKSYYDAGATNLTFHLGSGTYEMKGAWDYDWGMLTGWHIKGAGRNLTIVRQVAGNLGVSPGSNGALFSNGRALTFDNQSVEDLTCDCAWFRSGPGGDNSRPHGNFQGVNLYGANPTIRNVTVTGCGWQDNECFAILTSGGINNRNLPDNALYENVVVTNGASGVYGPHLSGMAMINLAAMANNPTPVYAHNGRILNCTFNLPTAGNAGGMPAGYDSGIVTGSTFIGYYHGMFHDTFVSKNISIVGNSIEALYPGGNGILFNAGTSDFPSENLSIIGNSVSSASGIGFASAVENSLIAGNRIRLAPASEAAYSIFLDTGSVQNISVRQNNIDAGIPYLSRNTTGCTFSNNRTPNGASAIPDSSAAGATYADVSETSGLNGPIGIAVDSKGNLSVVSATNAKLQQFAADGSALSVSGTGYGPAFIALQPTPQLVNVSTRLNVLTGENILTGGFILSGAGTKKLLLRGLGPSLTSAGVSGALADPVLELHGTNNSLIASNDNWADSQQADIAATGIAPQNSAESAIVATLDAGAYTVIESGKNNGTGVGLLEIYDLQPESGPELANISTRGFVSPGNSMIAGFIASKQGNAQILVRGLGPSLGAYGVADPLANPSLELHDANGALLAANDNWKSDQQGAIAATGIAPSADAEAAILATLPPGAYTAVENSANGGSGVGLIEVYNLH